MPQTDAKPSLASVADMHTLEKCRNRIFGSFGGRARYVPRSPKRLCCNFAQGDDMLFCIDLSTSLMHAGVV